MHQTFDFVVGRVAATADADEAVRYQSEAIDNGCSIKIAIRDENAPFRQRHSDVVALVAAKREREGRRASRARFGTIQLHSRDVGKRVPELGKERVATCVQGIEG